MNWVTSSFMYDFCSFKGIFFFLFGSEESGVLFDLYGCKESAFILTTAVRAKEAKFLSLGPILEKLFVCDWPLKASGGDKEVFLMLCEQRNTGSLKDQDFQSRIDYYRSYLRERQKLNGQNFLVGNLWKCQIFDCTRICGMMHLVHMWWLWMVSDITPIII